MFMTNPFAALSAYAAEMQGYIVLMVLFVFLGTVLDMMHKKSAKYFFLNSKKAKKSATREVSGGEKIAIAAQVLVNEVATAGEFHNVKRRISHMMIMWGFILFASTTAIQIFGYSEAGVVVPEILPQLWHLGALSLALGGYWFWFFIRVDVSAEGNPWYRVVRADLFILSLLATSTFALIWSYTQFNGIETANLFLGLFALSGVALFGGVYWSKFAHMFFKPAAAFQKRVTVADGSLENLPPDYDLSSPEVHKLFPDIPTYMGKNPPNMGPGIRREAAKHY